MTKLLIGLTSGLYTFDLVASGGGRAVLPGVRPITFGKDPSEDRQVYCVTYNRGLCRSEDAGEKWLPVGTPQGFFEGPTGGAVEPRETTFVSVDPVPQEDGRHAVWVGTEPSLRDAAMPEMLPCKRVHGKTRRGNPQPRDERPERNRDLAISAATRTRQESRNRSRGCGPAALPPPVAWKVPQPTSPGSMSLIAC